MPLTWQDSRAIGELLFEKFGEVNPLTVRFTDMHKAVLLAHSSVLIHAEGLKSFPQLLVDINI